MQPLTGIEIIEAKEGYCRAQLKISEKHLNAVGVVQVGNFYTSRLCLCGCIKQPWTAGSRHQCKYYIPEGSLRRHPLRNCNRIR